jgi:hypothetical protein
MPRTSSDGLAQVPVAKSHLGEVFLGAVSVPDVDVFVSQQIRVGGTRDEPHCERAMIITPFTLLGCQPSIRKQGPQTKSILAVK